MGNSRQDYGDCGAASLGNSCYQTLRRERATFAVRWEGGKNHALHAHLTGGESTPRTCVREWERRRRRRKQQFDPPRSWAQLKPQNKRSECVKMALKCAERHPRTAQTRSLGAGKCAVRGGGDTREIISFH